MTTPTDPWTVGVTAEELARWRKMRKPWESRVVEIELTFLRQTVGAHDPDDGRIGDCYRTGIACLLGLDDPTLLPHFVEDSYTVDRPWEELRLARVWLREHHDVDLMAVKLESAIGWKCPYLLSVHSKTGPWAHSVVARGRMVVHDPSGIGGYTLDDMYDEACVLVLCEPYAPDPDEMVRLWSEDPGDGALVPEDAQRAVSFSGTGSTDLDEQGVA